MNNMDNDDEQYNTIAEYSVVQYILHVTYNRIEDFVNIMQDCCVR